MAARLAIMPTTARDPGPTAARVATNVRALREARRLELTHLSERLERLGQPIGVPALSRLETGKRRVDVDDLVALALALDVSPARLLLPPPGRDQRAVTTTPGTTARDAEVQLTPGQSHTARDAWGWATGDETPRDLWGPHGDDEQLARYRRWEAENQPFSLSAAGDVTMQEVLEHQDVLDAVVDAVNAAEDHGASRGMVWLYDTMQRQRVHRDREQAQRQAAGGAG